MRSLAVMAAFLLAGCAEWQGSCPAPLAPATTAELYFGRSLASGEEVSDAEWQRFVDEEITPRFPDGLTIENAYGQWKNTAGILRERSKHVIIVSVGAPSQEKLAAIRAAYKSRFHQESVLLIETRNCASF